MEKARRVSLAACLLLVAGTAFAAPPVVSASSWVNTPPLTDGDLQTHVVLLDFWASWCLPCVRNLPTLQSYADALKQKPFTLIGVHYEADDAPAQHVALYLRDQGVHFPVAIDSGDTFKRFMITHVPTYVLIDKTGTIRLQTDEPPPLEKITALLDE